MRRLHVFALLSLVLVAACGGGDGGGDGPATSAAVVPSGTATSAPVDLEALAQRVKAARFSDLVVVGRSETTAEREAQQTRCASVTDTRSAVAALAGGDERARAYQAAVQAPLSEVATYCTWYVRSIAVSARQNVLAMQLGRLIVPTGQDATYQGRSIRCSDEDGCLPGDADKARYLSVLRQNQQLTSEGFALRSGTTVACPLTDLEAICALTGQVRLKIDEANALVLRRFTALPSFITNPAIARTYTESAAIAGPPNRRLRAAYLAAFPGVDNEDPSYTTRNEVRLVRGYERRAAAVAAPMA